MFNVFGDLNWLAIILATAVYYILGGLWFSTMLFGNAWEKAIGFERPDTWRYPTISFVSPLIGCLVISIATAILIHALEIEFLRDALVLGLIIGIGYAGAVSTINAVTPITPRPLVQGAINGAYHIVGIVVVSLILAGLR